ncbi:hypothetical protein EX30DRAFT_189371 [Ascodesmis nigricans]|uniref:Uncharacterized protein n=1 Tax=Ascodesmis nigricans TaxID=341454 RepID=A0A4S2N0K1_9PEZI|nr:hypothetical protein EX30DRAFT_189371 [Ascodesmis nigricans]
MWLPEGSVVTEKLCTLVINGGYSRITESGEPVGMALLLRTSTRLYEAEYEASSYCVFVLSWFLVYLAEHYILGATGVLIPFQCDFSFLLS